MLSTAVIGAFAGIQPTRLNMTRFWQECVFRGLAHAPRRASSAWATPGGCSSKGCWRTSAIW